MVPEIQADGWIFDFFGGQGDVKRQFCHSTALLPSTIILLMPSSIMMCDIKQRYFGNHCLCMLLPLECDRSTVSLCWFVCTLGTVSLGNGPTTSLDFLSSFNIIVKRSMPDLDFFRLRRLGNLSGGIQSSLGQPTTVPDCTEHIQMAIVRDSPGQSLAILVSWKEPPQCPPP